jgi:16S rRNA processing protein RimM
LKDTVVIGRVSGSHGIKGELRVFPLTDDVERFFDLTYVICEGVRLEVEDVRLHKGNALLTIKGIEERNDSDRYKGKYLEVLREDAVELEEGEYFIEDLKGLEAIDLDGTRRGILKEIVQTGAVDVLEFDFEGKLMMMPFLNAYVVEVNIEEGFIKADLSKCIS